jgi:2-amino-4-hydroxy-6-hydroxymethyldihydropteridine diphosphokinase
LNASTHPEKRHRAYICIGSNIAPESNIRAALAVLRECEDVVDVSTCWETEAVVSRKAAAQDDAAQDDAAHNNAAAQPNGTVPGAKRSPNFLNMAVCIHTALSPAELKQDVLSPLERSLGRVRTADKYAPRTMDLDLTVYDGEVLDSELWRRLYLALCFAELLPDLRHPETGETLAETAERLKQGRLALPHPELLAED